MESRCVGGETMTSCPNDETASWRLCLVVGCCCAIPSAVSRAAKQRRAKRRLVAGVVDDNSSETSRFLKLTRFGILGRNNRCQDNLDLVKRMYDASAYKLDSLSV